MENISFVKKESESESESESCDLIFRVHEMVMMMKLSSIPFWQLSPIITIIIILFSKRIIITLFILYGMMMNKVNDDGDLSVMMIMMI